VSTLHTELYIELFVRPVVSELDRRILISRITQQALDLSTRRDYFNDPANCY
jgi:hypothetical protein